MSESFFNKVGGLQVCKFIKKRLQHRCFLEKFAKFLRTNNFEEHLRMTASILLLKPSFQVILSSTKSINGG